MTQWTRWSALCAVVAFVSGCPGGMMRPDAGGAGGGGSLLAGGGISGVGGGSAGGMMTAGGRAGGQAGGMAGGMAGGAAGGMAGGTAGGMVEEDAGVDAGMMEPIDGGMLMGGETCEAPVLLPGTPISLMSTTTGLVNDYLIDNTTGCAESISTGAAPDVVYSVLVPAGQAVTASVTSTWNATINLVASAANCTGGDGGATAFTCLSGSNAATSGTESTSWLNGTGADTTVLIIIDGVSTGSGDFTLDVSVAVPPPGDTCVSAIAAPAIGDGGVVVSNQTLTGFISDFGGRTPSVGCSFLAGADRVYSLTIPPGLRLNARATSQADLSLSVVEDVAACTAMSVACVAEADALGSAPMGQTRTESLFLENANMTPRPVLLIVDSVGAAVTFELELSIGSVPPGEACDMAPLVMPGDAGVTLTAQSLGGYASDFDFNTITNSCLFSAGPDRSYLVTVPPNLRLSATVSSSAVIAVNIVPSTAACQMSPLECLGAGETGMSTQVSARSDVLATSRDVLVIVDASGAQASGSTFDLSLQLSRPPYTVTTVSGACDSFASATVVPLLTGSTMPVIADEAVTATLPLPFAFSSFGTPVTHYSVSSNGFLQLFTSAAGIGDEQYTNVPIPDAFEPNGVVAPFWDDLDGSGNPAARVVGAVFGTGSMRRYTVQWEAVPIYGVMGSSVTMQARLYETTNVIELHLCAATPGTDPFDADRERGLSASVGIESPDGTDGQQFSFETASLTVGQVIRYTP
jgi:hypothetical protein